MPVYYVKCVQFSLQDQYKKNHTYERTNKQSDIIYKYKW